MPCGSSALKERSSSTENGSLRSSIVIGHCSATVSVHSPRAFPSPSSSLNSVRTTNTRRTSRNCRPKPAVTIIQRSPLDLHECSCSVDVMTNIARTIPHLTKVVSDIEEHAESRIRYEDAPYVIEVILPCICSYLPYWWPVGPQKAKQPAE